MIDEWIDESIVNQSSIQSSIINLQSSISGEHRWS